MEKIVTGKQARHVIIVSAEVMTEDRWQILKDRLELWLPENGQAAHRNGFTTVGQCKGWLVKMLKKPGWPSATTWELWRHTDGRWLAYERKE